MGLALDPLHWGILILTGCFVGLCLGLLGRPGELAAPPALLIVLSLLGLPDPAIPRLAAATAIAILIPVAIAHSEGSIRSKAIDWDLLILLTPSAAAGTIIVTLFADVLDGRWTALAVLLGTALLAIHLFRASGNTGSGQAESSDISLISLTLRTVLCGAAAALIGVGGGLVLTPLLKKVLPPERAAATAAALTLPFALFTSLGYIFAPAPSACGPACAGNIFLPALAAAGMTAVLTAPLAARLRRFLPRATAEKTFSALVIATVLFLGLSSEAISALIHDTRDSTIDLVLNSLCEPAPAPAVPAFQKPEAKES